MSLTATSIRNAKPQARPVKLFDGKGLYLLVQPTGARWWRLKYRIEGREKLLSLGTYPDVSLAIARERRDEARKLLANGIDPSAKRQAEKEAQVDSFEAVAREWFEKFSSSWAASHADVIIRRLEKDVFPWIGSKPIGTVKAPGVKLAWPSPDRGARCVDTAHRAHQNCGQIFPPCGRYRTRRT